MKRKFYIIRVNKRPDMTCHKEKATARGNA